MKMDHSLIFFDCETSGINPKIHQILSFSMVMTDLDLVPLKTLSYNLKLKKDSIIDNKALLINQINPFASSWNASAISERELRGEILCFLDPISSPRVNIAYNASFDRGFLRESFKSANISFNDAFKGPLIDPMIGSKFCTKNGKIHTELKQNKKGIWINDYSLQGVAKELNTTHSGPAHNSLNDCLTLIPTTKKIYEKQFNMNFEKTFKINSKIWEIV